MNTKTSLSNFTEKQRQEAIENIIAFFLDERGEEIGIIAATEILEFIESKISPIVYKKAMNDSKTVVQEQHEQLLFKLTEKTLD